jgi:hypothetical protein
MVIIILILVIIYTNFIFGDMTNHTKFTLAIAIFYAIVMVPIYGYISAGIQNEIVQEQRLSF